MTKNQENKFSMYLTVLQVTNFHSESWRDFAPFEVQLNALEGVSDKIIEARKIQEGRITGVTKEKAKLRDISVIKGMSVSKKLTAYASVTGNLKLKDRISYTHSELIRSRDTIIINRLQVILEAVIQNISELAEYGITQEDADELARLINEFKTIVENPRQSITNRVRATLEIKACFAEADMILKDRLDNLIDHFKADSPVFWQQYKSARIIINLGHRKRVKKEDVQEAAA